MPKKVWFPPKRCVFFSEFWTYRDLFHRRAVTYKKRSLIGVEVLASIHSIYRSGDQRVVWKRRRWWHTWRMGSHDGSTDNPWLMVPCPKDRVVRPLPKWTWKWLINGGDPNHVSKSWDPILQVPHRVEESPPGPGWEVDASKIDDM